MRLTFAVAIVAIALVAAGCTEEAAPPEDAPDFSVILFNGATFNLSEHLATDGRPVFLNLWASWCPPCLAEIPDIDEASTRYTNVAFIGVAVRDDLSKAQAFADEIGVSYSLGFDTRSEVDNGYDPFGLPASYFISAQGQIVERVIGPLTADQIDDKLDEHFDETG